MKKQNKMATQPIRRLLWGMGLPMIVSMVLQALYNVIDSVFVANMGAEGAVANEALTLAFPVQILIIAVGVGTGVGLNALLSKSLGRKEQEKVNQTAGNGIFLSLCIYAAFLIFGLFFAEGFIAAFAGGDETVIEMGATYLRICTCFSFGAIGYTVYERFLQATGRTGLSTIAQIAGAVTNIVLDYIFIYPMKMGVAGAAWATVIGQVVSLVVAMVFHYTLNREVNGRLRYIRPEWGLIREIYRIGISAALMQALLSVMMAGMNWILGQAAGEPTILVGAFGIYYKIQQIALFAAFGLSNTIISILAFNYGMGDRKRADETIREGILDSVAVTLVLAATFEALAGPISQMFGLAGGTSAEMIEICERALRIASIGYVFMGFSVAIQGILQAIGYAGRPLVISMLRLVILVFPVAYGLSRTGEAAQVVWWTFPVAEVVTAGAAGLILRKSYGERVARLGAGE